MLFEVKSNSKFMEKESSCFCTWLILIHNYNFSPYYLTFR